MSGIEKIPIAYRRYFQTKSGPLVVKFLLALRDYADSDRPLFGFFGICGCADGGKGPTIETLLSLGTEATRRGPGHEIQWAAAPPVGLVEVSLPASTQSSGIEVLAAYCAICHECARSRLWVQLPLGIARFGLAPSQVLSRRRFRRLAARL